MRLLGGVMRAWSQDPLWVDEALNWSWVFLAARLALTSSFLLGGFTKLLDFRSAMAEQEHFGLRPGWLWALVLSGHQVRLGAGALAFLTAVAMLVADNFWTASGRQRLVQANTFFEHLGLIGGFVLVAITAAGR
jgi:uncharacterized membrane protein YphA (DoxX/SURF4 family)